MKAVLRESVNAKSKFEKHMMIWMLDSLLLYGKRHAGLVYS